MSSKFEVGLKLERLLKRFKPVTYVIIKDNYDTVYYEGTIGDMWSNYANEGYGGNGFFNRKNEFHRYDIENVSVDNDCNITIHLNKDKLEDKHYSKYHYDDEFISLAKERWNGMFSRISKQSAYSDVTVCEEWQDVNNYIEWFKDNWIDYDGRVDVDKDLIGKNSKIYSPETCCIIPHEINIGIRIVNKAESGGILSWDKKRQAYKVRMKVHTRHINTQRKKYKDALDLYFEKKDEFVKAMAEDFKDVIDKRAYNALMKYNSRELYLEKFGDYPNEYYE